jgi:hypothetical protein
MRYVSISELQRMGWSHEFIQRFLAESGVVPFKSPSGDTLVSYRDFIARLEQTATVGLIMMMPDVPSRGSSTVQCEGAGPDSVGAGGWSDVDEPEEDDETRH